MLGLVPYFSSKKVTKISGCSVTRVGFPMNDKACEGYHETYLLGYNRGTGIYCAFIMHHDKVRAALIHDFLHAVHTAALAACTHRHAGDGMVAAQAVHFPAQAGSMFTVL